MADTTPAGGDGAPHARASRTAPTAGTTSNVSLAVTATDNGTVASRQRSVDGGTTWVNANQPPRGEPTEGTTTVLYRATDNGGNVSPVGSVTIKIDKTAPVVTVGGVAEGASLGDSGVLLPTWSATDATSGVGTVTATLDGAPLATGAGWSSGGCRSGRTPCRSRPRTCRVWPRPAR